MQIIKVAVNFLVKRVVILSALAALLYNSWPLGFWLNYSTSVHGLASDLEQVHHPYSWVFIGGDLLSSLIILTICAALLLSFKPLQKKTFRLIIAGLMIFSTFTAV